MKRFQNLSRKARIFNLFILFVFCVVGMSYAVFQRWDFLAVHALLFVVWIVGLYVIDAAG